MENATKALLIAGGILIAIILIAAFLSMYNRLHSITYVQEEQKKQEQIVAFNAEYESFNKSLMYGVDLITLINKVNENNINYTGNSLYIITLYLNGTIQTITDGIEYKNLYKCTGITYNSIGRVSTINIENY